MSCDLSDDFHFYLFKICNFIHDKVKLHCIMHWKRVRWFDLNQKYDEIIFKR